jgi:hypothetical protein
MILCDTNIIIELFKGDKSTIVHVEKTGIENISISVITEMELLFGELNNNESRKIKKYLSSLEIVHVDMIISETAVGLIEKYSKSHHLQIPDSIIAATSIVYGRELFTYNIKDFKYIKNVRLYNYQTK